MSHFFRKIRPTLNSKPKKYIAYAIGEILIIIIGIMIAVGINNWNELRKQENTLNNIYAIIAEDLNNNIDHINEILIRKEEKKPTFTKVLNGLMTREDYEKCPECAYIIMGYSDLSIETRGYNLLNSFSNSSELTDDSLSLSIIQFYSEQLTELHADDLAKHNINISNFDEWENNYDWYSDFVTDRDNKGFIEYALTDHDYISRVATYYLYLYRVDIPSYEEFNEKATTLINLIEKRLNK